MCLICIEIEKDRLTLAEAWRNLSEAYDHIGKEHGQEVVDMLWEKAIYGKEEIDENTWNHIFKRILS